MEFKAFVTSKGEFRLAYFDNEYDAAAYSQLITANYDYVYRKYEDEASEIVDWNEEKYYYYKYPHKDWQGDISALESFHCLVKHNGFDPIDKNLFIFQLIKTK